MRASELKVGDWVKPPFHCKFGDLLTNPAVVVMIDVNQNYIEVKELFAGYVTHSVEADAEVELLCRSN